MKSIRSSASHEEGSAYTDGSTRSYGPSFHRFVYGVFVVNVLAVVVLLLGLLAGWFEIDGDRMTDGTYRVGLVFDTREVGDDIDETMNAASNLTETAKSATNLETYDGQVKRIDTATNQILLTSEGKDYAVLFTDATQFEGDTRDNMSDLRVGESVRLTVQAKNDQLFAVKVTQEVPTVAKN